MTTITTQKTNISIEQARIAYLKSTNAFSFIPRTNNEKLVVFYANGCLYKTYMGETIAMKTHFDNYCYATQDSCNRVDYKMLKHS